MKTTRISIHDHEAMVRAIHWHEAPQEPMPEIALDGLGGIWLDHAKQVNAKNRAAAGRLFVGDAIEDPNAAADGDIVPGLCARDHWIANQQAGVPVEDDATVEATDEQAPVMDARDAWIANQSCDPAMAPTPQTRGGRDGWIDRQVQRSGFFRQPHRTPGRRNF